MASQRRGLDSSRRYQDMANTVVDVCGSIPRKSEVCGSRAGAGLCEGHPFDGMSDSCC
jgi:hypothetical protein